MNMKLDKCNCYECCKYVHWGGEVRRIPGTDRFHLFHKACHRSAVRRFNKCGYAMIKETI